MHVIAGRYHALAKAEQCFCTAKVLSRPCLSWVQTRSFGDVGRKNRRPSRSTEKSWPHFRPSAVDFCCSRLAIGAATEYREPSRSTEKKLAHFRPSAGPFLQHNLPFWMASLVGRLLVLLIPIVAVLLYESDDYPMQRPAPDDAGIWVDVAAAVT